MTFAALVNEAYHHRISLWITRTIASRGSLNKVTGRAEPSLLHPGVAASGSPWMRSPAREGAATDILMDMGRPINEALDLGQVIGGFIKAWAGSPRKNFITMGLARCSPFAEHVQDTEYPGHAAHLQREAPPQ